MICDRERLAHFLQQLKALSSSGGFTKSDLLTPAFHLAKGRRSGFVLFAS